jgi:hypothetical protein
MFNGRLTLRMDSKTVEILNSLNTELKFSKSEIVRKALRVFKKLSEFEKDHGAIRFFSEQEKELYVLLT